MAILQNVRQQVPIYIEKETTNKSFLEMHYYLKARGIKNNAFMLTLYDPDLAGVNIYDPNLSTMMKTKILREVMINPWYYFRNLKIPVQGSGGDGERFRLHRGNMAMIYMMILNFNIFAELPRQKGKTTAAVLMYLWDFNFGTTNSEIMFIHKNHDGSKENLSKVKTYRESLPQYLRFDAPISDYNGKKLKVPNTTEVLQHPSNRNRIKTLPSAKNKQLANTLGRGCTQPLQYYDEFGWIVHNQLIYESATPAFDTASQNAKRYNSPYGILLTTTPGDMTTQEGLYAYGVRNNATPFLEDYYDFTYEELKNVEQANKNSIFFHICFSYKQLGETEEYFKRQVKQLSKNWAAIRREVLLEWSNVNDNNPFGKEDLDIIQQYCKAPIRTVLFGPYRQYQMLIYKDMDLRHGQIIGVDVSGGYRRDSSAITLIDAKTTEVTATLNCNYMPTDDLASVIYELVSRYLPNALVVIEKNGVGIGVISRLLKTSIKKNLFYTIKDHVSEERSNGVTIIQKKMKVKAYGIDNSKDVRARMIEILFSRVQYHKDKFIAQILHDEMAGLIYKTTNGYTRVDHSVNSHDDQIFSYLMAMYVWYDCPELTDRFGIKRGEIRTDDDIEEKLGAIEDLYGDGYEIVNIETETISKEDPVLGNVADILEKANKPLKTVIDLQNEEYEKDQQALLEILGMRGGKEAIEKAYNIDLSQPNLYDGYTENFNSRGTFTEQFFDEWYSDPDDTIRKSHVDNGNLYDMFMQV